MSGEAEILRERLQQYREILKVSFTLFSKMLSSGEVDDKEIYSYFKGLERAGIIVSDKKKGTEYEYTYESLTLIARVETLDDSFAHERGIRAEESYNVHDFKVIAALNNCEYDVTEAITRGGNIEIYKEIFLSKHTEKMMEEKNG